MGLDPKKIGYLRWAPDSNSKPRVATGPEKAMFNKLAKDGYISITVDGYQRTPKGDLTMSEFDRNLPAHSIAILKVIASGGKPPLHERGFHTLIQAGLVHIGYNGKIFLRNDAKALIDP